MSTPTPSHLEAGAFDQPRLFPSVSRFAFPSGIFGSGIPGFHPACAGLSASGLFVVHLTQNATEHLAGVGVATLASSSHIAPSKPRKARSIRGDGLRLFSVAYVDEVRAIRLTKVDSLLSSYTAGC